MSLLQRLLSAYHLKHMLPTYILTQNKKNILMRTCSWNLIGGARLGPSTHCLWLVLRVWCVYLTESR